MTGHVEKLPALIHDGFDAYLADEYLPQPTLRSGMAADLVRKSPRHVWIESRRLNPMGGADTPDRKAAIGTAAHKLALGKGEEIVEIDADSYRTNAAKAARDDAVAAGKTPLLATDMAKARRIAEAAQRVVEANADLPSIRPEWSEGTILWREGGVICACRPDWFDPSGDVMIHLKTTEASVAPQGLARFASGQNFDMTAAHYAAGALALTGKHVRQYFVMVEQAPPHGATVFTMTPDFIDSAEMLRRQALKIWRRCVEDDDWPAYDPRTIELAPPPWRDNENVELKDYLQASAKPSEDALRVGRNMMAIDAEE